MKLKAIFLLFSCVTFSIQSQNSTFSPYSRYGLGELASPVPAHINGMGGTYIAMRPDSTAPIFINTGNPASYALIRLTTLELGGTYVYSDFRSSASAARKWGTNFSYGTLGFPVRSRAGMCLGLMPYSHVGYDVTSRSETPGVGDITTKSSGSGGLSKAFIGFGIMPFKKSAVRYYRRNSMMPDSVRDFTARSNRRGYFFAQMLSDISIGANLGYLFGNISHNARITYPNSLLYNYTYRERVMTLGGVIGNAGIQTAFSIDSIGHRSLNEKVKITLGYFVSLNNTLRPEYSAVSYNYILSGAGNEIIRDTAMYNVDQPGRITLPLEQGFGIGFRKGERINFCIDLATTAWSGFVYLNEQQNLKDNFRVSFGLNYVPSKDASGRGSFGKRVNYRVGATYTKGHISLNGLTIDDMAATIGLGLPVGANRNSAMVNLSLRVGTTGTTQNGLLRENYVRVGFGFSFADRWFQKVRYD